MATNRTTTMIDWLQIGYKSTIEFLDVKSAVFKVEKRNYGTKLFNDVYDIYWCKKIFGTFAAKPRQSFLGDDFVMFKMDNSILYKYDILEMVNALELEYSLQFNNISRLDLCVDFNVFANGIDGQKLITNFIKGGVRRLGKGKFNLIGKNEDIMRYDYLKFGSSTSDVVCYLYNKSLEMKEAKYKPYIIEAWKKFELNTDVNVWRLEFSIKQSNKKMIAIDTGAQIDFKSKEILEHIYLHELFFLLVHKYFRFKRLTGLKNISEENDLKLFNEEVNTFKFTAIKDEKTSSRFDRIVAKWINNYNNEVRELTKEHSINGDLFFKEFIKSRGLQEWAEKKL